LGPNEVCSGRFFCAVSPAAGITLWNVMTEDAELLRRYSSEGSEAAFAELTQKHVNLVYSAALRLMQGDVHSAQDVTQQVFAELARRAKQLASHPALVGWLYTTTRLMALKASRTEQRRKTREQEANAMNQLLAGDAPEVDWNHLRPVIEDVMHELNDKERHALLLRFFQNKTLGELGLALNLTENAARMRVERALEKLRGKLVRRGITTTTAALGALLSVNAAQAAPVAFVISLPAAAIASAAVPTSAFIATTQMITMTAIQKTIVVAALAAAIGAGVFAVHRNSEMKAQLRGLQQQQAPLAAQIQQSEQDLARVSDQLAALSAENSRLKSAKSSAELLKLRVEVGVLRQQAAANSAKATESGGGLAKLMNDPATKEYMRKAMMDKMKALYGDLIKELKLTPDQTEQFVQLLSGAATKELAQLAGTAKQAANPSTSEATLDVGKQLQLLLGDAGCARFKAFGEELPARATLNLLNDQLGETPLSAAQSASLIQAIKTEPGDLTRGILGAPDKAFLGTQSEIDNFLQQVVQSNQRILQQAGGFLNPNQLEALDSVLTKALEARKLQGLAFFKKD